MIDFCLRWCLFFTVIIYPPFFIFHFTAKEICGFSLQSNSKQLILLITASSPWEEGASGWNDWIKELHTLGSQRLCQSLAVKVLRCRNKPWPCSAASRGKDSPGCIRLDTHNSERGWGDGWTREQKGWRERERERAKREGRGRESRV